MSFKRASEEFSFVSGFVQNRDVIRVLAQADRLSKAGEPNSTIMKFVRTENRRYDFHLGWNAAHLSAVEHPNLEVFAAGPDGRVNVGTTDGDVLEQIGSPATGPKVYGQIRHLRIIGNYVYATGMGRQVYRREGKSNWVHRDAGVLQKPSTDDVKGYNSIDGTSDDNLYAVGFGGEIWQFQKEIWSRMTSPTNLILNCVRAVAGKSVFVCGPKGTLLRERNGNWEVVEHQATEDELWTLEWFKNKLYAATDNALFRMEDNGTLKLVDFKMNHKITYGSLHASDGLLLSVGRKHIVATEDGIHWANLDGTADDGAKISR